MKAKKSFGQHFLNREDLAEQIANGLLLTNTYDQVLEVGPGRGMLTKYLLEKPYGLKVAEADNDMVAFLNKHFPQLKDHILAGDFLRLDLSTVFGGASFGLIGNFPYNISSQIVFKMLDFKEFIPELVGMFQKEMAERIIAPPGSKTYGVISVLTQAFYQGEYLFDVDRTCFTPPPQVQSGVIRLWRKPSQALGCDEVLFKKVVKTAFNQRRKMLRNTLKPFFSNDLTVLEDPFYQKRPEQLGLEEYVTLTNLVAQTLG